MTVAKQVFNSLTEYIQVRQFLVLMRMMATLELNSKYQPSHWLIYHCVYHSWGNHTKRKWVRDHMFDI